ncbi:uncharacterized protein LOC118201286 isoform X2 [Stegodyphus dumicola]|uniref:uncharacterized protein LOC118201286 isoform X2 n=1 Tax=Stegodyphus dumicola TaxID=202533 RepID=UPI0015A8E428|nr:uncharacterized protein LOC118201286 isoform X2 [Stegodyphus dumicola]
MSYSNLKTYLPPELINIKPQVTGIEIDIFEASTSSVINGPVDQDEVTTNSDVSEKSGKTSDIRPMNGEAESQNVSSKSQVSSHRLRPKKRRDDSSTESRHEDSSNVSSVPSVNTACDISHNSDKLSEASEQISIIHPWSGSSATSLHSSADNCAGNKLEHERKSEVRTRLKRSPRLMELRKSSSIKDTESNKQNGSVSSCETNINYLCDLDIRSLIKECNVLLNKDDVERYTGSSFSASSGSIILTDRKQTNFKRTSSVASSDSDSVNQSTGGQAVKKRRRKQVRNQELNHPSPMVLKRKRESSPSVRSVRAKTFSSVKNTQSAKETSMLTKSSTPLSSKLSPKINNSVKKK